MNKMNEVEIEFIPDDTNWDEDRKIQIICNEDENLKPYLTQIMDIMIEENMFDIDIAVGPLSNNITASKLFQQYDVYDDFINKITNVMYETDETDETDEIEIEYVSDNTNMDRDRMIFITNNKNKNLRPYLTQIMDIMIKENMFNIDICIKSDNKPNDYTDARTLFQQHSVYDKFVMLVQTLI